LSSPAILYFDLISPYGYLAVERAPQVLGSEPELQPVLLGAIFKSRGSGSWAATASRAMRMTEIEGRARHYGLPSFRWPQNWPSNGLAAMRAAIWAKEQGRAWEFARSVYRAQFVQGRDPADVELLAACANEVGLDGRGLADAIQQPEIKDKLRQATASAWDRGVRGVPTLIVDGVVYYGDDQLELAAEATAA
jgi:2-hydroxychromene-2-carboxylate isomerase